MVRLKHRYILFDVLYPPTSDPRTGQQREKFANFSKSPKDCLLSLHGTSASSINARSIASLLKDVIEDHFGDFGGGTVGLLIIVKYFSNKTSTGIIRCSRTNFHQVMAALALVTKLDNYDVVMRCVHVSGTIRKCEEFSIKRNRQLIVDLGQEKSMQSSMDELILMFGDDQGPSDEEI